MSPLLASEDAGVGSIPTAAGSDSPGVAPTPAPAGSIEFFAYEAAVNFLVAADYPVNMPLVAGKIFNVLNGRIVLVTRNSTTVTTGLTYQWVQNGTLLTPSSSIGAAAINGTSPAVSGLPLGFISLLNTVNPDMTSFPIAFRVATPISGGGITTCTGKFVVSGYYQ